MLRPLSAFEILKYIYTNHMEFKNRQRAYTNDNLLDDMGLTSNKKHAVKSNYLSSSYVSKILRGMQPPSEKFMLPLMNRDIQLKIEMNLVLDGLFKCTSYREIDDLIARKKEIDRAGGPALFTGPDDGSVFQHDRLKHFEFFEIDKCKPDEPLFSGVEVGALRRLIQNIIAPRDGLFHWAAEPWSGASFVAYHLRYKQDIWTHFDAMCMVRPTSFDDPYREQLELLAQRLELESNQGVSPRVLAQRLREKRVLLLLCDACYIPDEESYADQRFVRRFISEVMDTHLPGEPVQVLTIGRSSKMRELTKFHTDSEHLNTMLKIQPLMRGDLFRQLFNFYREKKGVKRVEEGGSRLKRGVWHYNAINERYSPSIWPANIRLRAYFASNFENYSYFDPTMGFQALCNDATEMPLSIRLFHDDIVAYLKRSARGKHNTELRSLRFCSTAKHWLTDDALDLLRKSHKDKSDRTQSVSELTRDAFEKRLDDAYSPIMSAKIANRASKNGNDTQKIYTVSLGVRAVVQDEWRMSDPYNRAVAHWRVAYNLWQKQNDKDILAAEFPYLPHWGRSRILLLGECLRHLIRSCDTVATRTIGSRYSDDLDFPKAPTADLGGCDPWQVLNFCFSQIFQKEINGNRQFGISNVSEQTGRSLTKRHGAFEFAAELLQLLSDDLKLGKPHWALDEKFIAPYLRECAFAMLDLGELRKAESFFQNLCDLHSKESKGYVEDLLNLVLVKSELTNEDEAQQLLNRAIEMVANLEHASGNKTDSFYHVKKRILARKIHLFCLRGSYAEAVAITDKIIEKDGDLKRWDPDLIQNRILALSHCTDQIDKAMAECLAAIFRSSSEGFQHEALGYRILLGRLFRLQGSLAAADQVLDDVQRDILLYGCSERTYLNLLYEAGQTLMAEGRFVRAYASYLRPCCLRSEGMNYGRFGRFAAEVALDCLSAIQRSNEECTQREWDSVIESSKLEEDRHASKDAPLKPVFFEVDPLFGYYIHNSIDVIERLKEPDGVGTESNMIQMLLADRRACRSEAVSNLGGER